MGALPYLGSRLMFDRDFHLKNYKNLKTMFHILTTIATLLGYTSWLVTPAVRQQTETYGGDH